MKIILYLFLLMLGSADTCLAQRNLPIDKRNSWVQYSLHHPMHATVGKSQEMTGVLRYNDTAQKMDAVAIAVPIRSFNSNNANRDSHVLEVTEALKYPRITFTSNNLQQRGDVLAVTANVNFHNITRQVQFNAKTWTQGNQIFVQGSFNISLTAHGVARPSLLMVQTDDSLVVTFRGVFNK